MQGLAETYLIQLLTQCHKWGPVLASTQNGLKQPQAMSSPSPQSHMITISLFHPLPTHPRVPALPPAPDHPPKP